MAVYCPSCGRTIPSDSRVCAYCGKSIPAHGLLITPDQEKKKDKLPIIIAIVVILLIIIPIAIAATVYVYVSGMIGSGPSSSFITPSIVFTQDDITNTLTVQYVSSSSVLWSFIDVQGNCDTSGHRTYVYLGDTLKNCTGTIKIVYMPTNANLGSWTFT